MAKNTAPSGRTNPVTASRKRAATSKVVVPVNGDMVRWLRMRNDQEMSELAERVGVTRPYINKIETGKSSQVSVKVFRALREALGLTPNESHVISANSTKTEEV